MASKTPRSEPAPAALAGWLAGRRWYATKTRRIAALEVEDRVPLASAQLLVVGVTLDDGSRDRYAVPLADAVEPRDALDDAAVGRTLLDLVGARARAAGEHGEIRGVPTSAFPSPLPADLAVRRLGGEQSNTSITFGEALILKHFRRLPDGVNPDAEITRFLTERTSFGGTPRLAGHLEYHAGGRASTLAVVQELVRGGRDGWQWMLEQLGARQTRDTVAALRRLGERTAELHLALASDPGDPAFAPETITLDDVAAWMESVERQIAEARRACGDPGLEADARAVALGLGGLLGRTKLRHHGDFHLGQTLHRPEAADWAIIDFEGEPLRPLAERRRKHAVVRDVAGMLRSINYAAMSAGGDPRGREAWESEARAAFLDGYRAAAGEAGFLPLGADAFTRAVAAFELEKAAYEIVYEANNRPDWLAIPRRGFVRAAAALTRSPRAGAA